MDFSSLPDNAFLQIFKYLPFNEQVRLGIIDKTFHRMSIIAISETKSLDLEDPIFKKLTPEMLDNILVLCRQSIQIIKLDRQFSSETLNNQFVKKVIKYSFPRLIEYSGGHDDTYDRNRDRLILYKLLTKNKNLRIMNLRQTFPEFPQIVHEKLENLSIEHSFPNTLQTMIGRFPNLKSFSTAIWHVSLEVIDDFFGHFRNLESVNIGQYRAILLSGNIESGNIDLKSSAQFWNLTSLTKLEINGPPMLASYNDIDIKKIADSLSQLRELSIGYVDITANGFHNLAKLKELRKLELRFYDRRIFDSIDIASMIKCGRLEELSLNVNLSLPDFLKLIRYCPDLRILAIPNFDAFDDMAVEMIRSFAEIIGERKLTVKLYNQLLLNFHNPKTVNAVLREFREIGIEIVC